MSDPTPDEQTDIDERLFVTRDELRRVVKLLEVANREALLVALRTMQADASWKQSLDEVQKTWVKIHKVLDRADDE